MHSSESGANRMADPAKYEFRLAHPTVRFAPQIECAASHEVALRAANDFAGKCFGGDCLTCPVASLTVFSFRNPSGNRVSSELRWGNRKGNSRRPLDH